MGDLYDSTGSEIGSIEESGNIYNAAGENVGYIGKDGNHYNARGEIVGRIGSDGAYYDSSGEKKYETGYDGDIYNSAGERIGRYPSGQTKKQSDSPKVTSTVIYQDPPRRHTGSIGDTPRGGKSGGGGDGSGFLDAIMTVGAIFFISIIYKIYTSLSRLAYKFGRVLPYILIGVAIAGFLVLFYHLIMKDGKLNKKALAIFAVIVLCMGLCLTGYCVYETGGAKVKIKAGDYEGACEILYPIRLFPTANALLTEYNLCEGTSSGQYLQAIDFFRSGKYYSAAVIFHNLRDYKDSSERFKESINRYVFRNWDVHRDGKTGKVTGFIKAKGKSAERGELKIKVTDFFMDTDERYIINIDTTRFSYDNMILIRLNDYEGRYRSDLTLYEISDEGCWGYYENRETMHNKDMEIGYLSPM